MKFKEFDTVRILRKCNEEVQIGDIGVIVIVFDNPNEAYEVEVIDGEGLQKLNVRFFQMNWNQQRIKFNYGYTLEFPIT